ncbi:SUF system Fe-S cluster assembly regulator [Oceanibaculum pacificum]|uniref:BadM/Rrf2 family transcriptional regulator n=1 Tax=Oceanibaculum pacificum TaxID=580166 RepID=A0A154VNL5_9PROT|nr:SUF system Fe-S cluster assembly regulator [Oceanibaculum pacificum]KZD02829.1 BadM/Rrf2 family transcriptional regulator [Oceanibaculum pacificum]
MIRLNRLTDYAIVLLGQLAQGDESRTAGQLAQDTGVPLPTVSKVLKMLANGKVITSQRGVLGGYALTRDADQITVAEIIAAMEGPIALTACVDGASGGCEVETLCPMRGNWDKVNRAIRDALTAVTLQEMLTVPAGFDPFPLTPGRRAVATAQ